MKNYPKRIARSAFLCSFLSISMVTLSQQKIAVDVCVYGATSAGVIAAIECANSGKTVALISQDKYVGGVTASGLGATDINNRNAIGGLAREFYKRIYHYYAQPSAWKVQTWEQYAELGKGLFFGLKSDSLKMMWMFEPHVAKKIFADMLNEAKVKVHYNERLDLNKKVGKKNGSIQYIEMENGNVYTAKAFIDASYEGDLMAKAGVSYIVGRESNTLYNEVNNGVLPSHIFGKGKSIDPYIKKGDPRSGLLPFIESKVPGEKGATDKRVQAYCYRFTLTTDPQNKIPFTKPVNYNPLWFEFLARLLQLKPSLKMETLLTLTPLPNKKTDTNHADFVGACYDWADGSYATREKLAQMHRDYVLGILWFLSTDPRVPKRIKDEINTYGLPKDEFGENGNFPHQIYVREARRMISDYVMTEHNYYGREVAPESVGLGTYWLDSHVVSRYVDSEGNLRNEGPFWENRSETYPIDYKAIIPKEQECKNLLVPVCLSSSHAAYGSIRMEPQYMLLAQSAAIAACLSIDKNCSVQKLPYEVLRKELLKKQQILDKESTIARN